MVEREVRSIADIADFIYQVKNGKRIKFKELCEAAGVAQASINNFKNENYGASAKVAIKVLLVLNVEIVLYTDELEERVQVAGDIVSFINKEMKYKNISAVEICKKLGFCTNTLWHWKENGNPIINNAIKVLSFLNAKMVLRSYELEDWCAKSKSEGNQEVGARDVEHGKTEVSEFDMLILGTAEKALKNCNSLSEKERLYKVLQAFL